MQLVEVECFCPRCGVNVVGRLFTHFRHDLRCWGWYAALYNAREYLREVFS
jgi:hypothetical protein